MKEERYLLFDLALYDSYFYGVVVLIFVFTQSDYLLTIYGYSLYKKYYAEYYTLETYELNPIWRKNVEKGKKFDIRHLLLTLLIILLYALIKQMNEYVYTFMAGFVKLTHTKKL